MANSTKYLLSLLTVNLILNWICVSAVNEKYSARVLVIQDRSVEDGFKVEIESNGEKRELQLTRFENIWSDKAQALHIKRNEEGNKIFERKDIPKDIKIYHDQKKGSFLSIEGGKINGILDSDYMIKSEGDSHFISRTALNEEKSYKNDYKIPKEVPLKSYPSGQNIEINHSFHSRSDSSYTVEVAVIVDSRLSSVLGSDSSIFSYLAIFWNGVNDRFATIESPKISIRLVGCVIIRNSEDEPFISKNQVENDYLLGYDTLSDGSEWIYKNLLILPDHDVIYIQSGLNLTNSSGFTGLAGIAFTGGVCAKSENISFNNQTKMGSGAVGLGEDVNGVYRGVHTATHEIAHTLGSPHDNDTKYGTGDCKWDEGYIMSYVGGSINRLFFSKCSKDMMAQTLATSNASCTTENIATTKPAGVFTSAKLPGDMITMNEQCQEITGYSDAVVYSDANPESELCYNLKCVVFEDDNYRIKTTGKRAAEGSECPSGKHCNDGQCV